MMEFVSWDVLGTYAGALAMVALLTQFTKNLSFIQRLPTQLWSAVIAFGVLVLAKAFTGGLTHEAAAQCLFNAVIVSMGANGVHSAATRITSTKE